MKLKLFALAALVAASGSAFADAAPYAKVSSVSGLVTVSTKSQMMNAKMGMLLSEGSQVLVSSTGSANVVFANGCAVFLKPGQAMAVSNAACSAVNAQRTSVGAASSAATGGLGATLSAAGLSGAQITALALLAGAATVATVVEVTKDDAGNATVT
ncbi:MAG: hypothetical protein WEK74_13240, partial [Hydrogenophaga sp.]